MNTAGISNTLRFAILGTQVFFLCACNLITPANRAAQSSPAKVAPATKATPASGVNEHTLNEQRVIVLNEGIDKDGLRVSYSMKTLSDGKEELLQLSLVFRNMKEISVAVTPKVVLSDANGVNIPVYSKQHFGRVASSLIAKSRRKGSNIDKGSASAIQEQLEWDKAFWLSRHFKIPASGIQIGGLVFHSSKPLYPMQLVVSSEGKVFQFTINDPGPTAGKKADEKKADEKKASECHSPALGTALYLGSKPSCRE